MFITHDLDEAIRIGDRIAIMKDGVIIQVGTAEEIVLKPADPYVAEFVAGISRLHLIKAHSVMASGRGIPRRPPRCRSRRRCRGRTPEADIDELIDLALAHPGREASRSSTAGRSVGVVSWRSLLRGVKGTPASEPARLAMTLLEHSRWTLRVITDTFDAYMDDALIWVGDNGAFLFDFVRKCSKACTTAFSGLLELAPLFVVAHRSSPLLAWRLISVSFGVLVADCGLAACWR